MIISEQEKKINQPDTVSAIMTDILKMESEIDREKEHFWVLGLSGNNTIKYIELVSLGILNQALVHPREVFRLAIMKAVNSIILVHNHPSGELQPSRADIEITEQLRDAGEIIGIKVLDHVVISGQGQFYSMQTAGIIFQ